MVARRPVPTKRPPVLDPPSPVKTKHVGLQMGLETLAGKMQAELQAVSLYLPPQPRDDSPVLPDDPTALGDSALMTEMRRFTEWADFLGGQLSLAEVEERYAEDAASTVENVLLLQAMPSSEALRKREDTMTRVRTEVASRTEMQEAQQRVMVAYAQRKLLQKMWERFDRDAALLSRELTRRSGGEDAKTRRARGKYGT